MIKKYSTVFIVFLCSFFYGYGQILTYEFSSLSGNETSFNSNFNDSNLSSSIITRGSGLIASNNGGRFNATDWALTSIANAVTDNDYMEFTISPNSGFQFNISTIILNFQRSGTGTRGLAIRNSLDSFAANIDIEKIVLDNTNTQIITFTVNQINSTMAVTYRIYGWAEATTGSGGIGDGTGNDIIVNGAVSSTCTPPVNPSGTITGTTAACSSTSLTYTGTDTTPLLLLNYWQTSTNGTDKTNDAINPLNVSTTGTYYVRKYDVTSDCWSTNSVSYDVIVDNAVPNITSQPTNQNEIIPNTANFSVDVTGATSYQWEINTGSGWNNVSTGTNGSTNSYSTEIASEIMNGYQYRCVITNSCGSVTSNTATLTLTNSSPNNPTSFYNNSCFLDDSATLSWDAPASGATPDGYIVFAIEGVNIPNGTKGNVNNYTAESDFSIATAVTPATLGKVIYKGATTSFTVTGLTENQHYSFAVFAYRGNSITAYSNGSGGSEIFDVIAQDDIRNFSASPDNSQMTLNWLRPTPLSCWDEIVIFANEGAVTINPSGDGSAYTENEIYSTPNQVVYKGTGIVKTITGLSNGTNYCFKAYVRRGSTWSDGMEICETPIITYCNANSSSDAYNSGITGVTFNTINNTGTSANNTYVDYTNLSTNVNIGASHDLSVNVNVDGSGSVFSRVWIDWNIDGDFNDSNEEYDLGALYNPSGTLELDGATSESPLSIEVPTTAIVGSTRMRVAAKWGSYPTSCEDNYSGEIEDYTVVINQPANAEINIKGNNITIPNGFNAPYGLNNTLYASTDITAPIALLPLKSFFIHNLGLSTLNFTNTPIVEIIGDHPGDFTVTQQPAASINAGDPEEEFIIRFNPTTSGIRKAQVRIYNNDPTGSENPYIFDILGTGSCSTSIASNIWPVEGPEDTEITITSATNLTDASAELNGLTLPIVSTNPGKLVVTIPNGATDGNIVILFSTGCTSTQSFDVKDEIISTCQGSSGATTPSDLFISEVTDATSGSSTLIEIYNGTANAVDLSDYSLKIYNNGSSLASSTSVLSGTLAINGIYIVSIGTTSCNFNNIGAGIDLSFNGVAGINFDTNKSDAIILEKTSGTGLGEKDIFGVKGSATWANGLSVGSDGVNFRRFNTATPLPSLIFNSGDWDILNWTNCSDSNYANIGVYDFSLGTPPNITQQPIVNVTNCDTSIDLIVTADEGYIGGLYDLKYHWFYLAPDDSIWTEITSDSGPYKGFDQATLEINFNDVIDVNGYQYYCQIRENIETCYTASKAVKVSHERAFWNVNSWSSTPDSNKLAVINGDYNTNDGGSEISFEACSLVINAGNTLKVSNGNYVLVQNDVLVYGSNADDPNIIELIVDSQGSFVQVDDSGTFALEEFAKSQVNKKTAPLANLYTYTYWSSPVKDALIGTALFSANPNRLYYFDASAFNDPDGDGIDDIGDDWKIASLTDFMEVGRGYASTHTNIGFNPGDSYVYNFAGEFNTGNISQLLSYDNLNTTNHWNLVGNPYPSAINVNDPVDGLFAINAGIIKPEVYMWSQYRAPLAINPGNQNLNFNQDDYVTINSTGPTGNGSDMNGDNVIDQFDVPGEYIPSGQSFFVSSLTATNLVFNNAMRISGNNANNQFFEPSNSTQEITNNPIYNERLWLNLISDNGVANQLLVGYVNGATDDFDLGYDTKRNLSANSSAIIYTGIDDISNEKFVIQGKNINSLNIDEVIPVGFETTINVPTIFTFSLIKFEGSFLTQNNVFIKDNLLNKIHNLKELDYNFSSEVGEFNDRFEIVFKEAALSLEDVKVDKNTLQIVELQNGDVQFKVSSQFGMKSIEILDLMGRTLYKLNTQGHSQTLSLSNLSQAPYFAKVELTNDHVITKKALKRK